MTVADLGIAVHSESARQATGDLSKLTNASAQAEAAVERLGKSSSTSNADLAKIAAGVEKATGLLERLSSQAANTNAQLAKMASGGSAAFRRIGDDAEHAARRVRAANNNIVGRGGISAGAAQAAGFNAGQQLQDIVMMSLLGQSSGTTALQQGPQLATAFQQGGGFAAVRSGLMSLLSPTTLITVGLVAAGSAAIQFTSSVLNGGKSVEDILKRHKEVIDEIAAAYPHAAEAAKAYEEEAKKLPQSVVAADTAQQIEDEKKKLDTLLEDLRLRLKVTGSDFGLFGAAGSEAFAGLAEQLEKGQADAEDVQKKLGELRIDPALSENAHKFAQSLQEAANEAARLEQHVGGTNAAQSAFSGVTIGRGDEAANMTKYLAQNREALRLLQRDREIAMARLGARSPDELAQAARRAEEANRKATESPDVQKYREDTAAALAYAQAMKQITDAQDARKRSLDATLASQQLDISLIGKTAGEVASAQFAFQQLQQIREEAARAGITSETEFQKVFGKEIDLIEKATAKIKEYADEAARAKLATDLAFERDQLGRSTVDQQIAARLRGAGLPVDLNGQLAQQMRDNQRYADAKDLGSGFAKTFGQELINSSGNIGKSFAKALESSLLNSTAKVWEKLADQLGIAFANWLSGGSGASAGGGAGAFGTASGFADLLFGKGAANDNYAPGAVTRAPLADIGSTLFKSAGVTKTGIPLSQIGTQGLGARVNSEYAARFQGLLSDLTAAGYPITSLGEGGYSYRNVAGSSHLSNHAFGNAIDINPRQNPWAVGAKGNFAQYGVDPNELAQKNGLFWGGNWNKSDAMHFQVDKTVKSLDKLSTSSIDTAQSLSGGLGKLGSSLSQFPAAPSGGGGGGLFSWLGGLFGGGGLSSAFSGSSAFSWLSANPGGYIGLYADGTENAPPGWAWVGERGPELRKLRGGDVIRSNPRSMQMVAENSNGGGMPAFSPVFNVDARGSTMSRGEFEQIARQQSEAALASYHKNQVRGGFGSTQKRYASQKG